jgi:hypothetical protein
LVFRIGLSLDDDHLSCRKIHRSLRRDGPRVTLAHDRRRRFAVHLDPIVSFLNRLEAHPGRINGNVPVVAAENRIGRRSSNQFRLDSGGAQAADPRFALFSQTKEIVAVDPHLRRGIGSGSNPISRIERFSGMHVLPDLRSSLLPRHRSVILRKLRSVRI